MSTLTYNALRADRHAFEQILFELRNFSDCTPSVQIMNLSRITHFLWSEHEKLNHHQLQLLFITLYVF